MSTIKNFFKGKAIIWVSLVTLIVGGAAGYLLGEQQGAATGQKTFQQQMQNRFNRFGGQGGQGNSGGFPGNVGSNSNANSNSGADVNAGASTNATGNNAGGNSTNTVTPSSDNGQATGAA